MNKPDTGWPPIRNCGQVRKHAFRPGGQDRAGFLPAIRPARGLRASLACVSLSPPFLRLSDNGKQWLRRRWRRKLPYRATAGPVSIAQRASAHRGRRDCELPWPSRANPIGFCAPSLRSVFSHRKTTPLHMPRLKQNGIESSWLQTSLQPLRQWPRRVRWFSLRDRLYVVIL